MNDVNEATDPVTPQLWMKDVIGAVNSVIKLKYARKAFTDAGEYKTNWDEYEKALASGKQGRTRNLRTATIDFHSSWSRTIENSPRSFRPP
jgi:hypothetical protein